jgi:hypothetical protein
MVLGTHVETILGREILAASRALTNVTDEDGLLTYLGSYQMRRRFFSVTAHQVKSERVLKARAHGSSRESLLRSV